MELRIKGYIRDDWGHSMLVWILKDTQVKKTEKTENNGPFTQI